MAAVVFGSGPASERAQILCGALRRCEKGARIFTVRLAGTAHNITVIVYRERDATAATQHAEVLH